MKATRMFSRAAALLVVVGLILATAAMAVEKANQQTITGVVEQGAKGISVIKTDDGQTFTIIGQNLSAMIGKTVKVTGMLTKGSKNRSVVVSTYEEVKK